MLTPTIIFLLLLTLALASPLTSRSHPEGWPIPEMKLHFMGTSTQTPIPWAPNNGFDSTIEFTVVFPLGKATCTAHWPEGQLPTTTISCGKNESEEPVEFSLSKREDRDGAFNECNFVLHVEKRGTNG
ncbi:uncharacterized protein BDR25DRAFT_385246 [Lindgomyces ingoldianus]|uniref:Uncharacterized protein n=1 Tax=Lindgomyces ingoldianus TaxID=673940 RepID=A0ACB6Q7L4_9PLEO|nr:uncharacterized protein BDR25DRAFT_385246 [Lindgomyces ingoldianus]KAF2462974.1 hypothetical protein BDR25DRAFT_385246 [Lindgomyces ingoldianus]